MFEAGALSKNIGASRVIPLLFDVEPSDLVGPMTQFQAAEFAEDDVRRVVLAINGELGDHRLAPEVVQDVFEMWWPRLQARVKTVLTESVQQPTAPARSDKDILEEVLALTRSISRHRTISDVDGLSPSAVDDLMASSLRLLSALKPPHVTLTLELREALDALERPLLYLAGRTTRSARVSKTGTHVRAELELAFAAARKAADDDLPF
jgi:hypothetical protein